MFQNKEYEKFIDTKIKLQNFFIKIIDTYFNTSTFLKDNHDINYDLLNNEDLFNKLKFKVEIKDVIYNKLSVTLIFKIYRKLNKKTELNEKDDYEEFEFNLFDNKLTINTKDIVFNEELEIDFSNKNILNIFNDFDNQLYKKIKEKYENEKMFNLLELIKQLEKNKKIIGKDIKKTILEKLKKSEEYKLINKKLK